MVDTTDAEQYIRSSYLSKVKRIPGPPVYFSNTVDRETPSIEFRFITEYLLHDGIQRLEDFLLGCLKCRHRTNGKGCEDTRRCDCMQYAAVDEEAMTAKEEEEWERRQTSDDDDDNTDDLPKHFPYLTQGPRAGCLTDYYLESRDVIYECNRLCGCGPRCKNRNVQHGRRIELEIFKTETKERGFGESSAWSYSC